MWIAALALVSAAWGADAPKPPAELPAPAASAPVRLLLDQAATLLTQQKAAEALAAADQALAKAKGTNDVPGEALSQRERALRLEVMKRPDEARAAWEAAGAAWRQAGDGPGEVEALNREAMLHPEGPERERCLAGALAIAGKEKRRALALSAVLHATGDHADDLGWESAARDLVNAAVAIRERIVPGSAELADSLFLAGYLADGRRELAAAKDYDQRALAIQEKLAPDSPDVAATLNNLGIVAYHQGDLAAAKAYRQRALELQEKLAPDSLDVAASLRDMGVVAEKEGDLMGAEERFREAWGPVRAQTDRVGDDEARQAFGTQYGFYAASLVACQLQRKETGDALATLEEGRAQALQQLLDERGVTASVAPPELRSAISGSTPESVSGQQSVAAGQQTVVGENDGALQAWKILQFHLKADLVVPSACETGLGSRVPGEGLIGFTRAWQIAGARSVVASEWKVDDASTAALMEAFHREIRQGTVKDEALRCAMLATAKRYPHPYFWAPFLLVGDPENHLVMGSER